VKNERFNCFNNLLYPSYQFFGWDRHPSFKRKMELDLYYCGIDDPFVNSYHNTFRIKGLEVDFIVFGFAIFYLLAAIIFTLSSCSAVLYDYPDKISNFFLCPLCWIGSIIFALQAFDLI